MKSKFGVSLKMRQNSIRPGDWQIWLNGMDISSGLSGVTLYIEADDITQAEMRVRVDELELDAETLALLEAHVRGGQQCAS